MTPPKIPPGEVAFIFDAASHGQRFQPIRSLTKLRADFVAGLIELDEYESEVERTLPKGDKWLTGYLHTSSLRF